MAERTVPKEFNDANIRRAREFKAQRDELAKALADIAGSNPNQFDDPVEHANWCIERARHLVGQMKEH